MTKNKAYKQLDCSGTRTGVKSPFEGDDIIGVVERRLTGVVERKRSGTKIVILLKIYCPI